MVASLAGRSRQREAWTWRPHQNQQAPLRPEGLSVCLLCDFQGIQRDGTARGRPLAPRTERRKRPAGLGGASVEDERPCGSDGRPRTSQRLRGKPLEELIRAPLSGAGLLLTGGVGIRLKRSQTSGVGRYYS